MLYEQALSHKATVSDNSAVAHGVIFCHDRRGGQLLHAQIAEPVPDPHDIRQMKNGLQ